MLGVTSAARAYLGPFLAFFAILLLAQGVAAVFEGQAAWYLSAPMYWAYPMQTVVCGALLLRWRRRYDFGPMRGLGFASLIAVVVWLIWIAPQTWLGQPPRTEGFHPWFFSSAAANYAGLAMRFLRLVIVVPLVEEIFWRGFLLRWLIDPHWERVPFGTFTWTAFLLATAGFALEHQMADWPAALLCGALYNWVAVRTGSLGACVLAHAGTNLLLGVWVMRTGQWGFW
jgi:CAAX prenyl protease-like protein